MTVAELLADAFGRIRDTVHEAVDGLTPGQLAFRPDNGSNSIAWLTWHLTRVQDDHIADVAGTEQVWTAQGFYQLFALPFDPSSTGYGHGSEEVRAVRVDTPELLLAYYDAVHAHTLAFVAKLDDTALDRIVDEG